MIATLLVTSLLTLQPTSLLTLPLTTLPALPSLLLAAGTDAAAAQASAPAPAPATAPTAASTAPPTMTCDADTVRADELGDWHFALTVTNPGTYSIRGDSLIAEVTDLDPGVTRAPRHSRLSLDIFFRAAGTVSAGETGSPHPMFPATAERARIVFRGYVHDNQGGAYAFRDSVIAEGGPLTDAHASRFTKVKGKRIEIVSSPANGAASVPGVLLVPSEYGDARKLLRRGAQCEAQGLHWVAVSPPGYGQSEGAADLAGPATLAALEAGLEQLAAIPGTDKTRLAVWGTGRGATAALLLAAKHPELKRVVAQDASYDLWASARAADPATRSNIVTEAGSDSAAWRARSPLLMAAAPKAKLLVIFGGDSAAPIDPALAYVAARAAAGAPADTLYGRPGSRRFRKDPVRTALDFLLAPSQP